ncbi:hypothetical protein BDZ91DRAFT_767556 [Kalaharituber pfeilii]|nr:hypothetical protein BDZ91DRAFT_767556 [Kalaharituber pfeilii]
MAIESRQEKLANVPMVDVEQQSTPQEEAINALQKPSQFHNHFYADYMPLVINDEYLQFDESDSAGTPGDVDMEHSDNIEGDAPLLASNDIQMDDAPQNLTAENGTSLNTRVPYYMDTYPTVGMYPMNLIMETPSPVPMTLEEVVESSKNKATAKASLVPIEHINTPQAGVGFPSAIPSQKRNDTINMRSISPPVQASFRFSSHNLNPRNPFIMPVMHSPISQYQMDTMEEEDQALDQSGSFIPIFDRPMDEDLAIALGTNIQSLFAPAPEPADRSQDMSSPVYPSLLTFDSDYQVE